MQIILLLISMAAGCMAQLWSPATVGAMTTAAAPAAFSPPTNNLFAWLPLDEAGGTRYDVWRNEAFTDVNTVGYSTTNRISTNSAFFDKNNNEQLHQETPNSGWSLGSDRTFCFWIYPLSTNANRMVITKYEGAVALEYQLDINTDAKARLVAYTTASGTQIASSPTLVPANVWSFVHGGIKYNAGVTTNIWISVTPASATVLNASNVLTGISNLWISAATDLNIGQLWTGGTANDYDGYLDEVYVFTEAASGAKLQQIFNAGRSGKTIFDP